MKGDYYELKLAQCLVRIVTKMKQTNKKKKTLRIQTSD